jgi:protein-tyrosine phosphatase
MGNACGCMSCHRRDQKLDAINDDDLISEQVVRKTPEDNTNQSESTEEGMLPTITVIHTKDMCSSQDAAGQSDLVPFSSVGWASHIKKDKQPSKLFSEGDGFHLSVSTEQNNLHEEHTWTGTETYTQHERWMANQSPSEILPTLYLGSKEDSMKDNRLAELKITHILSVTSGSQHVVPGCKLLMVAMADNGNSDLSDVRDRTFGFIEESQQEGNKLLVHCHLGQNRSPTVVIAWLMKTKHWDLHDAYVFVKDKRKIVHPHKLYIEQLREYDKYLNGHYSVLEDYLTMTVNDGQVTVAHENWTPKQRLEYKLSQSDPNKSQNASAFNSGKQSPVEVESLGRNDRDAMVSLSTIYLPLASISEQGFVQVADPMGTESSNGEYEDRFTEKETENCQDDSKDRDSAVSFQYSLGNVPDETPS